MTIKEIIEKLKEFPEDMEVVDSSYDSINEIYPSVWIHSNYPYNKPDKAVIVIR